MMLPTHMLSHPVFMGGEPAIPAAANNGMRRMSLGKAATDIDPLSAPTSGSDAAPVAVALACHSASGNGARRLRCTTDPGHAAVATGALYSTTLRAGALAVVFERAWFPVAGDVEVSGGFLS